MIEAIFAFADSIDCESEALSVFQTLSISFHPHKPQPLTVAKDVYYLLASRSMEDARLVHVHRLLDYVPIIDRPIVGSNDSWDSVRLSLEQFGDGTYHIREYCPDPMDVRNGVSASMGHGGRK